MIYADNAATTKMSETAMNTMVSLMNDCWGNPSSLYAHGQNAKEILERRGRMSPRSSVLRPAKSSLLQAEVRQIIRPSGLLPRLA